MFCMSNWVGGCLILLGVVQSLPNVKRRDELILYGNQQNQNHLSVKKSGPLPPLGKFKESTSSDFEQELHNAVSKEAHQPPKNEKESLKTVSDIEAELPREEEQEAYSQMENELKDKVREEKAKHQEKVSMEKKFENHIPTAEEERTELLKLKHMAKKREMNRKRKVKRSKKSLDNSPRFRKADELIRRSQETSMSGSSTLVRKKRDLEDYNLEEMPNFGAYLTASRDGYYEDEPNNRYTENVFYPVEEPDVEEYDREFEIERRSPENVIEEADEDFPDDLVSYNIVHDGVSGLFIPYNQNIDGLIEAALNKADLINEKENIEALAGQLARNAEKRSYDDTYVFPVVENRK